MTTTIQVLSLDSLDPPPSGRILAAVQYPHPGDTHLQLVLVERDHAQHRWVVWGHNSQCGGYHHGRYHTTAVEAWRDYLSSVEAMMNYHRRVEQDREERDAQHSQQS